VSVERVAKRLCQFDHGDDWERIWKSYDSIRLSYHGKATELLALLPAREVVAWALDPKSTHWLHESLAGAEAEADWQKTDGVFKTRIRALTYIDPEEG